LLLGIVIGGAAGALFFTGAGAGVGIVTGVRAGACLTVEAAKDKGFLTSEQVDEVLTAAVRQFADSAPDDAAEVSLAGGDAECLKVVDELKKAAN